MAQIHELHIEGHKLVALSFNPATPGMPIILLHGICGSVYYWNSNLLSLFVHQGPCYALSLPGHYPAMFRSTFKQKDLTAETIARLLTTAIHKLVGWQPVILVGHSTGGFAALAMAAHDPNLAHSIISIAGFAQGQWIGALGTSQKLVRRGLTGNFLFKLGFKLNLSTRSLHRVSLRVFTANPRKLFAYPHLEAAINAYFPYIRRLDLEAIMKYFAVMPDIDISPLLPGIIAPTLALTGDQDPTVPPAQSYLIAQKVPQADLAILKGSGHLPFFETPTEYQYAVRTWLRQQVS